ncbi:MAG: hypothetical protein AB1486_29145 [Planctomycetota bacterium]
MMLSNLDWNIVGLTLNVVGVFFLASSITFKKPRRLLWEYFGIQKSGSLTAIREYLLNKVQVYIGFVFLIAGFLVQMGVILVEESVEEQGQVIEQPSFILSVALLVASIIGVTILLKILQLVWSHRVFRRLLTDFFRENPWPIAQHPAIAKEIGELLQVPKDKDESIDEYVAKIEGVLQIDRDAVDRAAAARKARRSASVPPRGTLAPEPRR